jgi:hypothetical protein
VGDPLANDKRYKVILWATGTIGRFAIRTILNRPNLELAGIWVHSESKDGQDAGTLAGLGPIGIAATRDADALLASEADCVMYVGPGTSRPKEARDDFCRILRAGKTLSPRLFRASSTSADRCRHATQSRCVKPR